MRAPPHRPRPHTPKPAGNRARGRPPHERPSGRPPTPREAHLEVVRSRRAAEVVHHLAGTVFDSGKPADRIINAYFREHPQFGANDRRFIGELFFALCRWWGWLRLLPGDGEFWPGGDPSASTTAPDNSDWLRVLFTAQLLDSEEVHPAAAVWKEVLGLTDYIEGQGRKPLFLRAEAIAKLWGIEQPHLNSLVPEWIFKELPLPKEEYGAWLGKLQQRPPLWLRAQTDDLGALRQELQAAGLQITQAPLLAGALKCSDARVNLFEVPAYRGGRVEVQDLSSQAIGVACEAKAGERWWDVCAGAGGKTLQLASAMQNKGVVVATDIRDYKLNDLRQRARRARLSNISPREWDGHSVPARAPNFDGVLVDAPCTCSGTWRRNPDARWTTTADEVREMAAKQGEILRLAARAVKPGGRLVYATCSFCTAENEDVVSDFLANHPQFVLSPGLNPLTQQPTTGQCRVWPQDGDCDGSFVARFRRRE